MVAAKKLNPAYVHAFGEVVNASPFYRLMSMELVELSWGRCRVDIAVEEKHLQPFGNVHGGVYSTLVDTAGFWAAYSRVSEEAALTTVEMKLNYLAPLSKGRLVARGRCLKEGKTLCLSETSVEEPSGRLLAHGMVTLMVVRNLGIQTSESMPPKFLIHG